MLYYHHHGKMLHVIGNTVTAREIAAWTSETEQVQTECVSFETAMTLPEQSQCIIPIWNMRFRQQILAQLAKKNFMWPAYIHPRAWISKDVIPGKGSIIRPYSAIGYECKIGEFCMVSEQTSLGHGAIISDNVLMCPGTVIGGSTTVGNNVLFGQKTSIRDKIKICSDTIFDMNSRVTRDVVLPGRYYNNDLKYPLQAS